MKRYIIWLVVAIMAIAMLGIIVIQFNWIQQSIRLNETKFEKEVASALTHVEKRLAKIVERNQSLAASPKINPLVKKDGTVKRLDIYLNRRKLLESADSSGSATFDYNNNSPLRERLSLLEGVNVGDLIQRQQSLIDLIDLKELDLALRQELIKRAINNSYHYGIWEKEVEDFVIMDGNFVVPESTKADYSESPINRNLKSSGFKIDLFGSVLEDVPGTLFIDFPNRNLLASSNVRTPLILSILFSAIVLLCFAYTVSVIFRQKKLSEIKTDFINNMTHEFKTPIATINLAADSINSPMIRSNPSKVGRFAGIIKQENQRMLSQVEKVLQMALLDKKDFKLKKSKIDVHDIIKQAVTHTELQLAKKEGIITTSLNAKNSIVEADNTHISNIVHNLLDNANKYSPDKPQIHISTYNKNGGLMLEIADHGIGMNKEQKKHIFDKFYRVHTGNVHDVKGFGLGLSYVKAMIDAHQGQISVDSELGKGSTFKIYLPFGVV